MPRRKDAHNLSFQLTAEQFEALDREAKMQGKEKSKLVAELLALHIPDFPSDAIGKRGKYPRKKAEG